LNPPAERAKSRRIMSDRIPPELDMLPDGTFRPTQPPIAVRVFRWAAIIALLAGGLALAALALWFALILIPVVIGAGLIAWLAYRYQIWRTGRGPGNRNVWRP
jgi:hypothetical protein